MSAVFSNKKVDISQLLMINMFLEISYLGISVQLLF